MEANEAKKPKRPRIGQTAGLSNQGAPENHYENHFNPAGDNAASNAEGDRREGYMQDRPYQRPYNRQQGGYQQRPYQQRQGGYQPRNNYGNQGGYQRNNYGQQRPGGYQQRSYQQRPVPQDTTTPAEGATTAATAESTNTEQQHTAQTAHTGYQPRNNYGNQGGYQRNNYGQQRPGGYQQRNNGQGGYQQRNNYGQQRPGGYQQRNNGQGGYQQRNNYGQQRPGGFQQRNNGQGGYQQRNNYGQQQGGYMNQNGYMNNNRRPAGPGNRFQKGPVRQGKSFTPRPKRIEYELPLPDPDEKIRLNKFMANAGICSRREADEFIQQGLVKVNGQVVTELGTKISHDDTVEYDEKVVALESKCYILLNKPKDCVTTSDDPNGRTTVLDIVKGACNERIYPVGRLDRNTTGVLLLTNDGDLASKLTHPKYVKKKIYHVWTDKDIAEEDMQRIADGIELEDGPIHADAISYATETDRNQAGIEIHSGRNRIVRRIFESLGYHVTKLDRVYFAGLTKKNLPRGRWRYLTQEEVNYLKMGSFE